MKIALMHDSKVFNEDLDDALQRDLQVLVAKARAKQGCKVCGVSFH